MEAHKATLLRWVIQHMVGDTQGALEDPEVLHQEQILLCGIGLSQLTVINQGR